MGYSTEFRGELKFTKELTASQLAKVKSFLGEDCRDHPEWNATDLTYIDLEFNDDFSGLRWDESEKSYGLVEKVNLIISEMKKKYSDFSLSGELLAQGEDLEDRWLLKMENGKALQIDITIQGKKTTCPHCGEEFIIEETE